MHTNFMLAAMLAMTSVIHGRGVPLIVRSPSNPAGSAPLRDISSAGQATVGKSDKAQKFLFLIDTGAANVWVPGRNTPGASGYNWGGKLLKRIQEISFPGLGVEVRGPLYEDDISIGGITAHNFPFVVNSEGKGELIAYGAVGMFGLSYNPRPDKGNSWSFFETLLIQKKVKEPEFGVFIGRWKEPGELTLGGYDATKFKGPITTVPVLSQGPWNIKVDGIFMKGKLVPSPASAGGNAIVDTGGPFISAPFAAAKTIFDQIPGAVRTNDKNAKSSAWAYPCNTPQALMPSVVIGGRAHPIDTKDFNNGDVTDEQELKDMGKGRKPSSPMCYSAMFGFGDSWSLGRPFMQSYYTVFHWGELYTGWGVGKGAAVSFVRAVHSR